MLQWAIAGLFLRSHSLILVTRPSGHSNLIPVCLESSIGRCSLEEKVGFKPDSGMVRL
jgi:hypothetical protein